MIDDVNMKQTQNIVNSTAPNAPCPINQKLMLIISSDFAPCAASCRQYFTKNEGMSHY